MTRRQPAEYNWAALEFDEQILSQHFTSPRQQKIQFTVTHHMTVLGNGSGSALDACYNIWQTRQASAHYGVDGTRVGQFVWDNDAAWSTSSYVGNNGGISIEHANSVVGDGTNWQIAENTWKTGAKLIAYLHKFYGLGRPTSGSAGASGTMRVHQSFWATACPGPFMMSIWGSYVAEAQRVYDSITGTTAPAPAAPAPVRTKSISQLADEVIAGVYGSGDQRRAALGSNYDAVQAEVNRKLNAPAPRPGVTTVAFQVIAGQWGTGQDRINRLTRAGYNAAAVQAEVNRLL